MIAGEDRRMLKQSAVGSLTSERLKKEVEALESLDLDLLRKRWRSVMGRPAPTHLSRGLLIRILAYRHQVNVLGDLDRATRAALLETFGGTVNFASAEPQSPGSRRSPAALRPGVLLAREYGGRHAPGDGDGGGLFLERNGVSQSLGSGPGDHRNQVEWATLFRPQTGRARRKCSKCRRRDHRR
jgi:hypothetical protein